MKLSGLIASVLNPVQWKSVSGYLLPFPVYSHYKFENLTWEIFSKCTYRLEISHEDAH